MKELIALLEKAEGPTREIDVALGELWPDPPFNVTTATLRNAKPVCPEFTSNLQAAVDLAEKLLPGCVWKASNSGECSIVLEERGYWTQWYDGDIWDKEGNNLQPALSLCLAVLRALEKK